MVTESIDSSYACVYDIHLLLCHLARIDWQIQNLAVSETDDVAEYGDYRDYSMADLQDDLNSMLLSNLISTLHIMTHFDCCHDV